MDKLRGAENYHQWADEMDNILTAKRLKPYIDPTSKPPPPLNPSDTTTNTDTTTEVARRAARTLEIETWESNDAMTLVTIQRNLTQQPRDLVWGIKTASEMWAKLKKYYEGKGHSLKSQYVSEIQELDNGKFDDITGFIIQFQKLYTLIGQVGMEMPDDWYTIMFIKAMSGPFPDWADRWRSNSRTMDKVTLDMLYEDITDEARDRVAATTDTNVALYANNPKGNQDKKKKNGGSGGGCGGGAGSTGAGQGNSGGIGAGQGNSGGRSGNKAKLTGKCNHCSKVGHKAADCWVKHPEKKP